MAQYTQVTREGSVLPSDVSVATDEKEENTEELLAALDQTHSRGLKVVKDKKNLFFDQKFEGKSYKVLISEAFKATEPLTPVSPPAHTLAADTRS